MLGGIGCTDYPRWVVVTASQSLRSNWGREKDKMGSSNQEEQGANPNRVKG